jgi:ribonucleoside-triphosphate reductase (formate)
MEFKNIDSITEESYNGYVYDIELEKNHYFPANNIISHNCRLQSDKEMLDLASQSNSFGAGGSISLGSHRVITTNFNRIALESNTMDEFFKILEKRVEDSSKILKSHRVLINKMAESGLQPFISNGWINMKRMFSTYGVLGIYECNLTLKKKFSIGYDITGEILTFFNEKCQEYSAKEGIIHNIEQIPGESFAVRLANVDKMIFGDDKVPYELYSNQFVPLWEDKSIWEKLEIDGKYNALLTGGGIVHARIGEKITSKQSFNLIDFAVKCGCEHFALNAVYSSCKNNHTHFGKLTVCPDCGSTEFEYMERVVGFFVPVSSWNKTRREWEFEKRTTVKL